MFRIDKTTKQINLTRGDIACIRISALNEDGSNYKFKVGDVVRFNVFERKKCNCVVLKKDTVVSAEGETVDINLTSEDTRIGDIINKDTDYWYEVELNPDTKPQTIVGYEINKDTGRVWEKIFKLLPEAEEKGSDV